MIAILIISVIHILSSFILLTVIGKTSMSSSSSDDQKIAHFLLRIRFIIAGGILAILAIIFFIYSICSNYNKVDTAYTFDEAIVSLPNGEIVTGKVDTWRDYLDRDQIQVTIDEITYLVHSSNVVLIKGSD